MTQEFEYLPGELQLDGSAASGAFVDAFGIDVSAAMITCNQCGNQAAFADHVSYVNAPGTIVRCRLCQQVVARVARTPNSVWLDTSGSRSWRLDVAP